MKEQLRRIFSIVLCFLLLFNGVLGVNDHIHFGEDHLHGEDTAAYENAEPHEHEETDEPGEIHFDLLAVFGDALDFVLSGIAVPVSA